MYYIDNVSLSLLMQLLRDEVKLNVPNEESFEQLKTYLSMFNSWIRALESEISIATQNYANECILFEFIRIKLTVVARCENKERLENFLNNYANLYNKGELDDVRRINAYLSIDVLRKQLLRESEESKYNLKKYYVHNVDYTPLILFEYFKTPHLLKEILFSLDEKEAGTTDIILFDQPHWEDLQTLNPDNLKRCFNCVFTIDMDFFVKTYGKKQADKKQRKKFAPAQQKIYNYLLKNAKEGIFQFSISDLKSCMKLTTKDRTLNEFRKQYIEIFSKHDIFNIIKYNRTFEIYEVNRSILTDNNN